MNNNYVLICIDVQPFFSAARNRKLLDNCKELCLQAKQDNAPIIILEYDGAGPTDKKLLKIISNYKNAYILIKDGDDGSGDVYTCICKHMLYDDFLKVCGVNTDACVLSTVKGLSKKLEKSKIEIIASACNTANLRGGHTEALNKMSLFSNVTVVS